MIENVTALCAVCSVDEVENSWRWQIYNRHVEMKMSGRKTEVTGNLELAYN
jgi:hypothetical protein